MKKTVPDCIHLFRPSWFESLVEISSGLFMRMYSVSKLYVTVIDRISFLNISKGHKKRPL